MKKVLDSSKTTLFIGLYLALLIILFFSMLHARPLNNPDEGRYANVGLTMALTGHYLIPKVNGLVFLDKPPLFFWCEALSIKLFGAHIWSMRLVPALFGFLGVIITWLGISVIFDRRIGFLSSLLLATCPLYWGLANYINLDLMVAVLITSSLLSIYIGLQHDNKKWIYAAYVIAALATLTKGLIGLAFPVIIIGLWYLFSGRLFSKAHIKKLRMPIGLLIYIIITVPWFIFMEIKIHDFFHYFFIYEQFDRFTSSQFNNVIPYYWFYIPVLLIGIFPWSVFIVNTLINFFKRQEHRQHLLFFLLWFICILVFFSIPKSKIVSYITPAIFPLLVFIALFLARNSEKEAKKFRIATAIIPILFIILGIAPLILIFKSFRLNSAQEHIIIFELAPLFIIYAIFLIYLQRRVKLQKYCVIVAVMMGALFLLLGINSSKFSTRSNQQFVQDVKSKIPAQEKVYLYYTYAFDMPVYFQKPLYLVNNWQSIKMSSDNWRGHFKYAQQYQHGDTLLISQKDFLTTWKGTNNIVAIMSPNVLAQSKSELTPYTIIAKNNRFVAITNTAAKKKPLNNSGSQKNINSH